MNKKIISKNKILNIFELLIKRLSFFTFATLLCSCPDDDAEKKEELINKGEKLSKRVKELQEEIIDWNEKNKSVIANDGVKNYIEKDDFYKSIENVVKYDPETGDVKINFKNKDDQDIEIELAKNSDYVLDEDALRANLKDAKLQFPENTTIKGKSIVDVITEIISNNKEFFTKSSAAVNDKANIYTIVKSILGSEKTTYSKGKTMAQIVEDIAKPKISSKFNDYFGGEGNPGKKATTLNKDTTIDGSEDADLKSKIKLLDEITDAKKCADSIPEKEKEVSRLKELLRVKNYLDHYFYVHPHGFFNGLKDGRALLLKDNLTKNFLGTVKDMTGPNPSIFHAAHTNGTTGGNKTLLDSFVGQTNFITDPSCVGKFFFYDSATAVLSGLYKIVQPFNPTAKAAKNRNAKVKKVEDRYGKYGASTNFVVA